MCSSALATGESLAMSDRGERENALHVSPLGWLEEEEGVLMEMLEGGVEGASEGGSLKASQSRTRCEDTCSVRFLSSMSRVDKLACMGYHERKHLLGGTQEQSRHSIQCANLWQQNSCLEYKFMYMAEGEKKQHTRVRQRHTCNEPSWKYKAPGAVVELGEVGEWGKQGGISAPVGDPGESRWG